MATFVAQPSTRVLLDPSKKKRRHDSVVKVQSGGRGAAGDKKPGDAKGIHLDGHERCGRADHCAIAAP